MAQIEIPEMQDLDILDAPVREQFEQANALVEKMSSAREARPEDLARALGKLGMVHHAYQDLGSASLCYRQAHILDPAEFRWAYFAAVVEAGLGNYEAAESAFTAALNLRPGDVPSLVRRGENALDASRLDQAELHFTTALDAAPRNARARYGISRLALLRDDPAAALEHLEVAHSLQPAASPILYSLGIAHRSLGDLERAQSFFVRVPKDAIARNVVVLEDALMLEVQHLVKSAMEYEHRGLKAVARGRYAVAATELRRVVALAPDRLEARHNLALALLHLRRFPEGKEQIDAILERDPDFTPTLLLLAGLRRGQGRIEEAEALLRRGIKSDPGSGRAHLALAELLAASGRQEEAASSFAQATELDPGLKLRPASQEQPPSIFRAQGAEP